jgi:hypothetical protein
MTRRWATMQQQPSVNGPANRVSKNRHTSYISYIGITHQSQTHFYFCQNVASITTRFGRHGYLRAIHSIYQTLGNINFVLLYVPCVDKPTKRTTSMRDFTATLHLQQLHYVTNQKLHINKIYFWFQTFALFWMLYSFFWMIPPAVWIFCADISEHSVPSSELFVRCLNDLWKRNRQGVPKRRYRKFRSGGITQKNQYNKIYSFYHILLFTDMFWSLLWPSSGCRTTI